MRRKLVLASLAGAFLTVASVGWPALAGAQDEAPTLESVAEGLKATTESNNMLWVVIGAALVIFMQAGFAMVETGFCRAKHAAHVVSTNFMIFGLGFLGFFLIGFPMMFGGFSYPGYFGLDESIGSALVGSGSWVFLWKGPMALTGKAYTPAAMAFFLYMVAFMDTTATIPTGAMAERWRWKAFVGWGLFCGALYYPLFGAWTWGGGWLSQLGNSLDLGFGYVDFAGSGVVHAMGGIASLMGASVLGARLGKFDKDGKPRALLAHNIPMAMLGTFILLFGWFGFNAASTFASSDNRFAIAATNTGIAAAMGSLGGLFWVSRRIGKPDPSMMANGMLAGLVAITAPCAFVAPWAAAVIGLIAGLMVVEAVWFVERRAKLDDPVGAISVHGVGGLFGVLCVGIFSDGTYGQGWNLTESGVTEGKGVTGILYDFGLGGRQLVAQAIGCVVIIVVGGGLSLAFFKIQSKLMKGGIRSDVDDEMIGLDLSEMGVPAYHDDGLDSVGSSPSRGSATRELV